MAGAGRVGWIYTVLLLVLPGASCGRAAAAPSECPIVEVRPEGMVCETNVTMSYSTMCFTEPGVNMQGNSKITYAFHKLQGETLDLNEIRVSFSGRRTQGILLQLSSSGSRGNYFVSVDINNAGGIKLHIDVGWERWELNSEGLTDSTDGLPHNVLVRLDNSSYMATLQLDDDPPVVAHIGELLGHELSALTKPRFVFIGNNDTSQKGLFGSIHAAQIGDKYLLPLAFQQPDSPFVQLTGLERLCLWGNSTSWVSAGAPSTRWVSRGAPPCSGQHRVVPTSPAVFGFCQRSAFEGKIIHFHECTDSNGVISETSYVDATLTEPQYPVCTPEVKETTTTTTTTTTGNTMVSSYSGMTPAGTAVTSIFITGVLIIMRL